MFPYIHKRGSYTLLEGSLDGSRVKKVTNHGVTDIKFSFFPNQENNQALVMSFSYTKKSDKEGVFEDINIMVIKRVVVVVKIDQI